MKLVDTFSLIQLEDDHVLLDGHIYAAMLAKHSIWIPSLEMKFPFQHKGHVLEFRDVELGFHWPEVKEGTWATHADAKEKSFYNIVEEYIILNLLSGEYYAPTVNGFFYVKNVLSKFPLCEGKDCLDEGGVLGYYMHDANTLPVNKFNRDHFVDTFIKTGIIKASESALNDITMTERDNLVNGWMVDIRRSQQDKVSLGRQEDIERVNKIVSRLIGEIK